MPTPRSILEAAALALLQGCSWDTGLTMQCEGSCTIEVKRSIIIEGTENAIRKPDRAERLYQQSGSDESGRD
jgi:hypothetical protein